VAFEQRPPTRSARLAPKDSSDPRWVRSRQALTEAVLALAAEQPIATVSVGVLTKRAGVNRATFYNHAKSPQALLQAVLLAELNSIFDVFHVRLLDSNGYISPVQDFGIRSIVEHVHTRQRIYRKSLEHDHADLLHSVLTGYLIEKSRILMDERQYRFSGKVPANDFEREFAIRAACYGLVGGIIAWLQESDEPRVDDFMGAYYVSLPQWFTMTGPSYS